MFLRLLRYGTLPTPKDASTICFLMCNLLLQISNAGIKTRNVLINYILFYLPLICFSTHFLLSFLVMRFVFYCPILRPHSQSRAEV